MKKFLIGMVAAMLIAIPGAYATGGNGGGHTPVTVCHKPGTPAQQNLTFDDDGWQAHINHGDYAAASSKQPGVPQEKIHSTRQPKKGAKK